MNEYKLVPVEPTMEMIEAARKHHEGEAYLPVSLYKAMLAAAPATNEPEEMKNAMQLAQGPMPATLGELHDYLDSIRKAWGAQDTKYLGSYESQPLYILPIDPTPGFHLAKAKYFAEFGLTFTA